MPLDANPPLTARIEVFRPGTFTPMEGTPITYSAADLRAIADGYDFATAPAPVVVGHPETDAPAYAWVDSFDYDTGSERLFANLRDIDPAFAEMVRAGRFRKVSMAYFSPTQGHNPVPGTWYPKHLGFLGAAAPAVTGLKNAHFAGKADVTFTTAFASPGIDEAASLFRRLRDFMIDRFGLEDADTVLPSWQIEWMENADDARNPSFAAPDFAPPKTANIPDQATEQKKEQVVHQQPDPAFAEREADITAREARIAEREAAQVHAEHVAYAESLIQDGIISPATKDNLVALLDALPEQETVSFAGSNGKVSSRAALKKVLDGLPKIVTFGALDLPGGQGEGKPAAFAADGKAVDPDGLARHQKALDYQRQHPGTGYIDAVRAVS